MRTFYKEHEKGLTLIEVVIVVIIMGILAGYIIPKFLSAQQITRDNVCLSHLRTLDSVAAEYCAAKGALGVKNLSSADVTIILTNAGNPKCPGNGVYSFVDKDDISAANCSIRGTGIK